jgi:hypothetical protein
MTMNGNKGDMLTELWVTLDKRLGSIPVVDIPVHNQDASFGWSYTRLLKIQDCLAHDGYRVDETIATKVFAVRMMARRSHEAKTAHLCCWIAQE